MKVNDLQSNYQPTLMIEELWLAQQNICSEQIKVFKDEINAFNRFSKFIEVLYSQIYAVNKEEELFVLISFLHLLLKRLKIVCLMILQGNYAESLSVLRTALEIAADLYHLSLNLKQNSRIWLFQNKKGYKKQFREVFGKRGNLSELFPLEESLLLPLRIKYKICCKYSSHSNIETQVHTFEGRKDNNKEIISFYEINVHGPMTLRYLLLLLKTNQLFIRIVSSSCVNHIPSGDWNAYGSQLVLHIEQLIKLKRTQTNLPINTTNQSLKQPGRAVGSP